MLLDRVTKETTDYTRVDMDLTWWLDIGETITAIVSSEISLGTTGWSEAPYPPPGAPPPYDPTPLLFQTVAIDTDGTGVTAFVQFGTPGNVYTCTFVLDGSSTRRVTVELGVQISGEPPVQPLPAPVLPPPQGVLALPITGGVLQGPLYLFEDPKYPTEAATKAYVDAHVGGVGTFLPLAGGVMSGMLTLAGAPVNPLDAATKAYVDAHTSGVLSFNTRAGAVALSNADVLAVLPPSGSLPIMNGTASAGSGTTWSRADHVHPVDTSRYAASNPSNYVNAIQATAAARVGTATNDNAAAGQIGEYISAGVAAGSGLPLVNATAINVTSISLTAGDWDVNGNVGYSITGSGAGAITAWVTQTSATLPTGIPNGFASINVAPNALASAVVDTGTLRFSLAATTTVYLCAEAFFNAGTVAAYGVIRARRMR